MSQEKMSLSSQPSKENETIETSHEESIGEVALTEEERIIEKRLVRRIDFYDPAVGHSRAPYELHRQIGAISDDAICMMSGGNDSGWPRMQRVR